MVLFSNSTIGIIIAQASTNVTGSQFLTLFGIILAIIILAMAFRIPLEYTVILVFPVLVVFAAFDAGFMTIFGVALIYMAVLFANNYFIGS